MANDFLDRYLSGDCEAVWAELTALGDLRDDVEMRMVTVAIAQEMMQRVQANIRTLAGRLQRLGFRFGEGLFGDIADDERQLILNGEPAVFGFSDDWHALFRDEIAHLEEMTGGLPIALRVFYEVVGSVNFVGTGSMWKEYEIDAKRPLARHSLSRYGSDPLFVYSPKMALQIYSDWQEAFTHSGPSKGVIEPHAIFIAPNYDYKFGIGGGSGPYELTVPCAAADASLDNEWHHTTFVNYLRICCRWGGFPGLEYHRDKDRLAGMIRDLTHDMLPF